MALVAKSQFLGLRKEWLYFAIGATAFAALPWIIALMATPHGGLYLGSTVSTDDHMVYAAWMHQAKDGHFFFDNRFTTQQQPALTVHLYFWLLGNIARVVGIPLASTIGRLVFSFLFLGQLFKFTERLGWSPKKVLAGVIMATFGGGLGFLVWHNFKGEITKPVPQFLYNLLLGRLPMDVKQPEAFVFPSMLNNGLFMVSMWLVLVVFQSVLDAKVSGNKLWVGFVAAAVLMNIHSYDVLLVGFVLFGLLCAEIKNGEVTTAWVKRTAMIVAGVVLPALWFVHVLKSDAVFQARAATETYSLNFRPVVFGLFPLMLLALRSLWPSGSKDLKAIVAWLCVIGGVFIMFMEATSNEKGYFMSGPVWGVAFVVAVGATVMLSRKGETARNLIVAWALIGLIAMYFPQLFQRKLAEGLVIPWAILAVDGLALLLRKQTDNLKQLAFAAVALICSASSLHWVGEDIGMIRNNVSTTTVHAPILNVDEVEVMKTLESEPGRRVVAAMPGFWSQSMVEAPDGAQVVPDAYDSPQINDLNPVASGLAGAYSIAGHWSETPNYIEHRTQVQALFMHDMNLADTKKRLAELGVTHVIVRLDSLGPRNDNILKVGKPIYSGKQLALIRVEG